PGRGSLMGFGSMNVGAEAAADTKRLSHGGSQRGRAGGKSGALPTRAAQRMGADWAGSTSANERRGSAGTMTPTTRQTSPAEPASAAHTIQPRWNAARASAAVGVPRTATKIATPRAAPICRDIESTALPVAYRPGSSDATPSVKMLGIVGPAPMPVMIIPGRNAVRK